MAGIKTGISGQINNNIVTDGLVFYVDPAYKKSYPGSGSTIKNLINLDNGTLSSSPTFDPTQGNGVLDYDGTDHLVFSDSGLPSGNLSGGATLAAWFKRDDNEYYDGIISYGTSDTNKNFFLNLSTQYKLKSGFYANDFENTSGTTIQTGVWYYGAVTYNGTTRQIYLNGQPEGNDSPSAPNVTLSGNLYIARLVTYYLNGMIGSTSIYDRALSASEVLQNYQAQKERFGF